MSHKLLKYLPNYYKQFPEIQALMNSEGNEIDKLKTALKWILDNQFVATSTETLKKRENELGIDSLGGESLDFRRLRIINRYSTRPPFTMKFLEEQISAMAEGRQVTIKPVVAEYKVKVNMPAKDADIINEMDRTVNVYLPANMVCEIGVADENRILFDEKAMIKEYDRYTKLGLWSLGNSKFGELVNEVTIID
ncbi:DUF2313 domain-containing protein [Clostridium sp. 'deep sea']|uniref:putative phage tail protein n=1 Tax=Clostridium sp. 'deep sea' TaxID=2779445 RepID=UPI0018969F24|nr:putative phage tail protein [Clostridium sp. 'deep sea']QOR33938.1 DUF2313 domain-containing protein [Clostridium sp. 'deep sea']